MHLHSNFVIRGSDKDDPPAVIRLLVWFTLRILSYVALS